MVKHEGGQRSKRLWTFIFTPLFQNGRKLAVTGAKGVLVRSAHQHRGQLLLLPSALQLDLCDWSLSAIWATGFAHLLTFYIKKKITCLSCARGRNESRHKGVFQREGERGVRWSACAFFCCIPRAAKILMIFNIDFNLIFSASLE